MSRTSDASGEGCAGSIRRSQLRTTSDGRSGLPSENVSPGRRWKVTRRPPSSNRHVSARAGRSCRSESKVVSDSNSWAVIAALPASPWIAGSRVVGSPVRIRTGRSDPAPALPPHEATRVASRARAIRRCIAGSIGRVVRTPRFRPGSRARHEASRIHTAGGTMGLDREASGGRTSVGRKRYGPGIRFRRCGSPSASLAWTPSRNQSGPPCSASATP